LAAAATAARILPLTCAQQEHTGSRHAGVWQAGSQHAQAAGGRRVGRLRVSRRLSEQDAFYSEDGQVGMGCGQASTRSALPDRQAHALPCLTGEHTLCPA